MHVSNLRIQNFRCFEDVTVEFERDLTVFVAKNGGGKTSVLDGLVATFFDLKYNFSHGNQTGHMFTDSDCPVTYQDLKDFDVEASPDSWEAIQISSKIEGIESVFGHLKFRAHPSDEDSQEPVEVHVKEGFPLLTLRIRQQKTDLPVMAYYRATRQVDGSVGYTEERK